MVDLLSAAIVLLVTFTAIVAGFYAYGMSHLREIKQNWVKYRCNPVYMPLAGMVGSDIVSNFTQCTMQNVQSYAGFVMDPLFQQFGMLQDVIRNILDSTQFIRQKMAGTVDAFLSIVSSVVGKIQNTMSVSGQLIGRIKTLMERIVATFIVLIHITTTGLQTGMSVANGPIGKTADFLCFDPRTAIQLKDRSYKQMMDIVPGDTLIDGSVVTSMLVFDGSQTRMCELRGIRVSGNHKVLHHDEWIRVEDHPEAIHYPSLPRIACLNTATHCIPIGPFVFRDYEETDNVTEFYEDVAKHYDQPGVHPMRYRYRTTGVFPQTYVRLENEKPRLITDVRIGDRVKYGGRVLGKIIHLCTESYLEFAPGVSIAPGTMFLMSSGKLRPAAETEIYSTIGRKSPYVMQLLVENAYYGIIDQLGNDIIILDDQEVSDTSVHLKRDARVLAENGESSK